MEIAKLEAIISGDVKPLVAALNTAKTEIQKFENVGADAFIGLNTELSKTAQAALTAGTDIRSLTNALDVLQAEQAGIIRGTTLWSLYEREIKNVNRQLDILEAELPVVAAETRAVGASATTAFGGMGKGLTSAFSGLKQIAYILPGLGIAGIFNLAFEAISAAASAMFDFGEAARETEEAIRAQNEEFAKTIADAQTELATVQALVKVAQDHAQSIQTRNNALNEAKSLYPGYLNFLNLENINSQEAANAITLLTDALIRKAKVQAVTNLLTRAEEELLKAQTSSIKDNLNAVERFIFSITKGGPLLLLAAKDAAENQGEAIAQAQSQIDGYIKKLDELIATQSQGGDFKLLDPEKLKKEKKEVEQILQDLNTNIKDINKKFIDEIAIETGNALGEIQKTLDKGPGIVVKGTVDFSTTEIAASLNDALDKLARSIPEAFDKIFSSIAKGDPLGGLFDVIGGALEEFGKQMIALAPIIAAIKAAIKTLNPAVLLPAGIALVAIGNLLQNAIPKFAEGGIATGPTLGVFGESGPEAIIPLDRLQNMVSGLGQNNLHITGELRAHGTDLVVALNRGNVRINRNYGSNFSN